MNKPNWQLIEDEYSSGADDVEIAALLGITMPRFFALIQEHSAFADFIDRGRTLSHAWWVAQARKNLTTKGFNSSLWGFNMKNRFGWADKTETNDTTDKDPVDINVMRAEFESVLKRIAKTSPELVSGVHLVEGTGTHD